MPTFTIKMIYGAYTLNKKNTPKKWGQLLYSDFEAHVQVNFNTYITYCGGIVGVVSWANRSHLRRTVDKHGESFDWQARNNIEGVSANGNVSFSGAPKHLPMSAGEIQALKKHVTIQTAIGWGMWP